MRTINLNIGQTPITITEIEGLNDAFTYKWTNAPEMIEKLIETSIITSDKVSEIYLLRWIIGIKDTLSQL